MNYQAGYFFHDPYGISEPGNGPTYQFILNASTSIATKVSLASFRFVTIRSKIFLRNSLSARSFSVSLHSKFQPEARTCLFPTLYLTLFFYYLVHSCDNLFLKRRSWVRILRLLLLKNELEIKTISVDMPVISQL